MYACAHICEFIYFSASAWGGQRLWNPRNWSHRQLGTTWCGCWELNLGPLQEQSMLLTSEPHHFILDYNLKFKNAGMGNIFSIIRLVSLLYMGKNHIGISYNLIAWSHKTNDTTDAFQIVNHIQISNSICMEKMSFKPSEPAVWKWNSPLIASWG